MPFPARIRLYSWSFHAEPSDLGGFRDIPLMTMYALKAFSLRNYTDPTPPIAFREKKPQWPI